MGRVPIVHSEWCSCSKASSAADHQRLTSASRLLILLLALQELTGDLYWEQW